MSAYETRVATEADSEGDDTVPERRQSREPTIGDLVKAVRALSMQIEQRRAAIAATTVILALLPQTAHLDAEVVARLASNSLGAKPGSENMRKLAASIASEVVRSAQLVREHAAGSVSRATSSS
jgi:hypothetical protein